MTRWAWILILACGQAVCARAVGVLSDVELVSRETQAPLPVFYHRGEYWIAGAPGEHFDIRVRNASSERILAVMSVDGVNIITGDSAGWEQSGYVFGAHEDCRITGWRKSPSEVAAFVFTPPPDSYAARSGRAQNIGVIGVSLFREKPATIAMSPPPEVSRREEADKSAQYDGADSRASPPSLRLPGLGTGHGPRETSVVGYTSFERRQVQPDEVILIRYDRMENLIARGIVPRPRWSIPDAFPQSQRFVPDPPG